MKIAFEIIGTFIVSLFLMAIPILCTLSFVYDWYTGFKFILFIVCLFELLGLMNLLFEIGDKHDKK